MTKNYNNILKHLTLILTLLFVLSNCTKAQEVEQTDTVFQPEVIFVSHDIRWEFDQPKLSEESFVHLDSIVMYLKENEGIILEVGVHEDCRSAEYEKYRSRKLSQSRAQSIVDYFVSKGIAEVRLIAKGYGAQELLISDTEIAQLKTAQEIEEAHAKNRRTEFKILSYDYVPQE